MFLVSVDDCEHFGAGRSELLVLIRQLAEVPAAESSIEASGGRRGRRFDPRDSHLRRCSRCPTAGSLKSGATVSNRHIASSGQAYRLLLFVPKSVYRVQ